MIKSLLGMATSALGGIWGYVAAAGLAAIVAGYAAYSVTNAYEQNTIKEMKIADLQGVADAWKAGWERRDAQDAVTHAVDTDNANKQANINQNTGEIVRYVTKYIPAKADAACVLPNGFVRVLDAALTGVAPADLPGSAAEPDDAPSGLTLSQASTLLAQSLGDYAATRARILNAADDWAKQSALPAPAKP